MKCQATHCDVCGRAYAPDEVYLQVVVESSTSDWGKNYSRKNPNGTISLFIVDADYDRKQVLLTPYHKVGGWMTTKWVCQPCVDALPPAWQRIFKRPKLEDWIPIEKLGEDEHADTETWLVRRREEDGES